MTEKPNIAEYIDIKGVHHTVKHTHVKCADPDEPKEKIAEELYHIFTRHPGEKHS